MVEVYDPWVDPDEAREKHGIDLIFAPSGPYDVVVIAVAHEIFRSIVNGNLQELIHPYGFVYDLKGLAPREDYILRL